MNEIADIPISDIYYDDVFNCRGEFTRQSVHELARSIREHSLLQPIVLRLGEDAGITTHKYHVVAGHRRLKAAEWWLNWETIPAIVKPGLDDETAKIVNLTENIEREDLTYVEQGLAIRAAFPNLPLREIGDRLNRSHIWVKQRLDLIKLSPKIQTYVSEGKLTLREVELLLKLPPSARETEVDVLLAGKQRGEAMRVPVRCSKIRKVSEIRQTMAKMLQGGASGIGTAALAWALGNLTDDEFEDVWKKWASLEGWRREHEIDAAEYMVDARVTVPIRDNDD